MCDGADCKVYRATWMEFVRLFFGCGFGALEGWV